MEVVVERAELAQVQLAVPAELQRLDGLIDHCERALVSLVDARGTLEDRIQPALSKTQAGDTPSLAAWAQAERGPGCSLSEVLALYCHRLEQLVDSMSAEEQVVRSITARVQL